MDSPRLQRTTLEMPLLVSPLRERFSPLRTELYSPLKLDQPSVTSITVHDDHDDVIETISVAGADGGYLELDESVSAHEDPEADDSDSASQFSACSSSSSEPAIHLAPAHVAHLNAQFETMQPVQILQLCAHLFPNLYQTTAFGLTGLVILDMLHKLASAPPGAGAGAKAIPHQPELIFLDTLHHFPETYALVERVRAHYSSSSDETRRRPLKIHTYAPRSCADAASFAALHGSPSLWATDPERYDFVAKVEPQQRAERELRVAAVITGRRRSQGGERGALPVLEVVPAGTGAGAGMVKINPLAGWTFEQVRAYVDEHGVPYNELLDRGYRSVGDWHSTEPVKEGEGEREGRWKGMGKTECGIHNKKSRYAVFLAEMARKEEEEKKKEKNRVGTEGVSGSVEAWTAEVRGQASHEETRHEEVAQSVEAPGRKVGFGSWLPLLEAR